MQLSPIYEQRLAEATQQGEKNERRAIIENLLRVRFSSEEPQLAAIIEPLLALPSSEFSCLLLQLSSLSKEDLLTRFIPQ
jgi:hypothetical protein